MATQRVSVLVCAGLMLGMAVATGAARAEEKPAASTAPDSRSGPDVSGYRGPARDGLFPEKGLLRQWPDGGPKLLWKSDQVGAGYGAVAVGPQGVFVAGAVSANDGDAADGIGFPFIVPTGEKRTPGKNYDTKGNVGYLRRFSFEGKQLWKVAYGPEHDGNYRGPRATPTVSDGLVIVQSAREVIYAFDAETGERKWSINPIEKFGSVMQGFHGVNDSPMVYGDRVYITLCSRTNSVPSFAALNKKTGEAIWTCTLPPEPTGKGWSRFDCSPIVFKHNDTEVLVGSLYRCVAAVNAKDGTILWQIPCEAASFFTPLYADGYLLVLVQVDKQSGVKMLKLSPDARSFQELWHRKAGTYAQGVVVHGKVFLYDDGLLCVDAQTGKEINRLPGGEGSIVAADGMVYWIEGADPFVKVNLVRVTDKGGELVSSFVSCIKLPHRFVAYIHPVVAGCRLYLRDLASVAVYDVRGK